MRGNLRRFAFPSSYTCVIIVLNDFNDRVKTYVPSRSSLPSWEGGVEHVVLEFQRHTSSLASQLVGQYRDLCVGREQGEGPGSEEEAEGTADER